MLLFPYYTARSGTGYTFNSLLTLVNTGPDAKPVKIKFMEGKNGRLVLGLTVYLSPYDVWTAAIVPSSAGGAAVLMTSDRSCLVPGFPFAGLQFGNAAYSGSSDDGAGTGLDRTLEGFVEVIEMGKIVPGSASYNAVLHGGGGAPPCTPSALAAPAMPANVVAAPEGSIKGTLEIYDFLNGNVLTTEPTALSGFSNTALWFDEGTIMPTLDLVNPKTSTWSSGTKVVVTPNWPTLAPGNPINPVTAVLMHESLYGTYLNDTTVGGLTDWVVTFPTKRSYVFTGTGAALPPFQRNFAGQLGSCDDIDGFMFNREELVLPGSPATGALCWTANIIAIGGSTSSPGILFSPNRIKYLTAFSNGSLRIDFAGEVGPAHQLTGPGSVVFDTRTGVTTSTVTTNFRGLPAIGFSATHQFNGLFQRPDSTILLNFSGASNLRYTDSDPTQ